jgi:hypothetical protein
LKGIKDWIPSFDGMTGSGEIIMKNLNYMSIAEDAMSKIKKGDNL